MLVSEDYPPPPLERVLVNLVIVERVTHCETGADWTDWVLYLDTGVRRLYVTAAASREALTPRIDPRLVSVLGGSPPKVERRVTYLRDPF